jgi:1-phosphatidylinositol phosphodiesterase
MLITKNIHHTITNNTHTHNMSNILSGMRKKVGLAAFALAVGSNPTLAHWDSAYTYDSPISQNKAQWMKYVPDTIRLNELAIPGTHDTMTYNKSGFISDDWVKTQTKSLTTQLNAGVRMLDIRARHYKNGFPIHHGSVYLNVNFDSVLYDVTTFLRNNPSETVVIRLMQEHTGTGNTRTYADTFRSYMNQYYPNTTTTYFNYMWRPRGQTNPYLSSMRGKIVFMLHRGADVYSNFSESDIASYGLEYNNPTLMSIQDNYNLLAPSELYDKKWVPIKDQLYASSVGKGTKIFINYLSGSAPFSLDPAYIWFVSSGHTIPSDTGPRRNTNLGWVTSSNTTWPDFPRQNCSSGYCEIFYEGTNTLTKNRLNSGRVTFPGIVLADFPGDSLIESILKFNAVRSMTLSSHFNGKCLDQNLADGNVQVWVCNGGQNQRWQYSPASGEIRSVATPGKCLDAASRDGNAYMGSCHGGANQKWDLMPNGSIKDRLYGQCLDLYAYQQHDGANVQMYTCNTNAANQKWAVKF